MRGLILTLLAMCLAVPAAADQVTASWSPSGGDPFELDLGVSGAAGRGQSFRPEIEGILRSVTVHLARLGGDGATIRVGVHRVDMLGLPVSPGLVERTFPIEVAPGGNATVPVEFDLSGSGVLLETDTNYALTVLVTPVAPDAALRIAGALFENANYPLGMALGSSTGEGWGTSSHVDFAFEVRIGNTVARESRSIGAIKRMFQ